MPFDWWARVPVRISSRGRVVVPPLRFWKGEGIRNLRQCSGLHISAEFCNCLELDGVKMLNKFLETSTTDLNMENNTFLVSVADGALHDQTRRNGQYWSLPEKSVQRVLSERMSECNMMNTESKRKWDRQEAEKTPPSKRRRTVGILDMRPVKNCGQRRNSIINTMNKITNQDPSEHKHESRSEDSPSTSRRTRSKQPKFRKTEQDCKVSRGMTTPTKKLPRSVPSASRKNKRTISQKRKRNCNSYDLFEDPLYACLLSSSDSDYSINLGDYHVGYHEKQSTPLSKYLDDRDESTDRMSVKSTPTRFHTKDELKQHVRKVRRMRAEKMKRSVQKPRKKKKKKKKKKPEKLCLSSDDDSVEGLSVFEQLKRALGLMDKAQKKISEEDRCSEEERYFGDSDD